MKKLNGNTLKFIAIITMTIDHLTWILFPGYDSRWYVLLLHVIGRITAPIMWYFIAEGFHYTRDKYKYAGRLLLFAVISHFAYNFCFGIPFIPFSGGEIFNQTGIIWALFLGLVALIVFDTPKEKLPDWAKIIIFIILMILAFPADWSCIPVLAICWIAANRGNFKKQMLLMVLSVVFYAVIYFIFIDKIYGIVQMGVLLSIPFISQYNDEKGKWQGMKWFFYIYYPLHLAILGILRLMLHGNISIT